MLNDTLTAVSIYVAVVCAFGLVGYYLHWDR